MAQYIQLVTILLSVFGAALWHERRITRIETLLNNHLAHSEIQEKAMTDIINKLLLRERAD